MFKKLALSTCVAVALTTGAANANVVTFDDIVGTTTSGYSPFTFNDGGLTFNSGGNWYGGAWDGTSPNSNGTENLIYSSDAGNGAMQITRQGGGAFDLNSLDLAISFYDGNATETVLINGTPLIIDQTDTTYNLNLLGVNSVDITGFGVGLYWTADNINFSVASTAVPEPVTLSLFSAGLVGAAAMRRRKKSKQA